MNKTFSRGNVASALAVFCFTFVIAIIVSLGSEVVARAVSSLALSFLFLFLVISIGIAFDIVGTSAAASTLGPLNARAARKVFGGRQAVKLSKNADKVANFCCDIIGDICGTVSGAIGASIVLDFPVHLTAGQMALLAAAMTSLIAALTVGGKALGKSYALGQANEVLFRVAVALAWWEDKTNIRILEKRR